MKKMFDKISCFFKNSTCQHSENEIESIEKTLVTENFERCIMCGKLTNVPVTMPIDWRENYEIGCGQLCVECAKKQQKTGERKNTLTTAQILLAVEYSRKEERE